jgi:hypothetical protein
MRRCVHFVRHDGTRVAVARARIDVADPASAVPPDEDEPPNPDLQGAEAAGACSAESDLKEQDQQDGAPPGQYVINFKLGRLPRLVLR